MPYEWSSPPEHAQLARNPVTSPVFGCLLSAHNALSREGFAGFIGATAALMAVPLLAFLATRCCGSSPQPLAGPLRDLAGPQSQLAARSSA